MFGTVQFTQSVSVLWHNYVFVAHEWGTISFPQIGTFMMLTIWSLLFNYMPVGRVALLLFIIYIFQITLANFLRKLPYAVQLLVKAIFVCATCFRFPGRT